MLSPAAALRGVEPVQFDAGTWHVEEDRLCRDWNKTMPLHACRRVVTADSRIELFDPDGLMVIDAQLVGN